MKKKSQRELRAELASERYYARVRKAIAFLNAALRAETRRGKR